MTGLVVEMYDVSWGEEIVIVKEGSLGEVQSRAFLPEFALWEIKLDRQVRLKLKQVLSNRMKSAYFILKMLYLGFNSHGDLD